jgi:hypothetical protein
MTLLCRMYCKICVTQLKRGIYWGITELYKKQCTFALYSSKNTTGCLNFQAEIIPAEPGPGNAG